MNDDTSQSDVVVAVLEMVAVAFVVLVLVVAAVAVYLEVTQCSKPVAFHSSPVRQCAVPEFGVAARWHDSETEKKTKIRFRAAEESQTAPLSTGSPANCTQEQGLQTTTSTAVWCARGKLPTLYLAPKRVQTRSQTWKSVATTSGTSSCPASVQAGKFPRFRRLNGSRLRGRQAEGSQAGRADDKRRS